MRRETRVKRVALGIRYTRGEKDNGAEQMADEEEDVTSDKEGAEGERDVIVGERVGEIKIEMCAAASKDLSSPTQLLQVLRLDHGGAGGGSGTKSRFCNVAGTAEGQKRN